MQICLKELCPKASGSFRMLICSPWRYGRKTHALPTFRKAVRVIIA
jgi:hypothetical protein